MTFNNDTTMTNYPAVRMYNFNNSNGSDFLQDNLVSLGAINNRQAGIVQIMDYSATDKHKTLLFRGGGPATGVGASATRWSNTAAITSIKLINTAGTLDTGFTLTLYAVIS